MLHSADLLSFLGEMYRAEFKNTEKNANIHQESRLNLSAID